MLQYEETTGAWSEIGKMKKARRGHAVVAVVDKSLYCYGIVVSQIRNNCHHNHRHSSPPLFTFLSSLIPCHILYPISYHCFQNYRLYSPQSSCGALRFMHIISLFDGWNERKSQTLIMITLIIILIPANIAILSTFTIYSLS